MGEIRDEVREIQGQIRGEKEQTNQKMGRKGNEKSINYRGK